MAFDTPRLWGRFHFSFTGEIVGINDPSKRLLLSKNTSLQVEMDHRRPSNAPNLFLLRPHLHRLEQLNVSIADDIIAPFAALFDGDLPRLSRLKLQVYWNQGSLEGSLRRIAPPPSLKHIHLDVSRCRGTEFALYFASLASNASSFHLVVLSDQKNALLRILELAPSVEKLELIETGREPNAVSLSPVQEGLVLAKVTSLAYTWDFGLNVFSRIQFPALETLLLHGAAYTSFITDSLRSVPNLRHISSTDHFMSHHILHAFTLPTTPIRSLDLLVSLHSLFVFSRILDERHPSDHDKHLQWRSLLSLTLTIKPYMFNLENPDPKTPIQHLVSAIIPRRDLTFTARVSRAYIPTNYEVWVEETKNLPDNRFSSIYVD